MSFKLILGQPRATAQLQAMVSQQNLPAALLFTGLEGCGKFFTALQLAKVINCRRSARGEACNSCADCRQIERQVHPDVKVVTAEKSQIKIDQVRELQTYLSYAPLRALVKVVIIDNAHLFNLAAASAMLKILEEPPDETLFILVTHRPQILLPTIISRCLQISFLPLDEVSQVEILQNIDEVQASTEILRQVVHFSGGSIARCLFFLAEGRLVWRRQLLTRFVAVSAGNLDDIFKLAAEISQDILLVEAAYYLFTTFIRDVLLLGTGVRVENLFHPDLQDLSSAFAKRISFSRLSAWFDELNCLQRDMLSNINIRLVWEALFLRLAAMLTPADNHG